MSPIVNQTREEFILDPRNRSVHTFNCDRNSKNSERAVARFSKTQSSVSSSLAFLQNNEKQTNLHSCPDADEGNFSKGNLSELSDGGCFFYIFGENKTDPSIMCRFNEDGLTAYCGPDWARHVLAIGCGT